MKKLMGLCVLLIHVTNAIACTAPRSQESQVQQPAVRSSPRSREWRAATYRGLTIGTSTRADVLRVFGQPSRTDTPADQVEDEPNPEDWYVYESGGEFPGEMIVIIGRHSNHVLRIDLYPRNLSREEAIRHFGRDYIITRYEFCEGFEDEDAAPTYESPDGRFFYIEYRERGVAIHYIEDDKVGIMNYVSEPIGFTSRENCRRANPQRESSRLQKLLSRYNHFVSQKLPRNTASITAQ